nr:30S ribosomal protein S5, chloroplastic [Tanacetum cinerariifolium]
MNSFQGLTTKSPSSWHRPLAQSTTFYDHVNPVTRQTIDQSAGGKLRDLNAKESCALLEDLGLNNNEIQRFMEAHLALTQPTQVNKVTTSCGICSVMATLSIAWKILNKPLLNTHPRVPVKREPPNRFQPNGSIPNRSFNNRPQSFNNQSNLEGLVSNFMASQDARLSKFEANFKQQQSKMTNKIDIVLKAITDQIVGALPSDMVKNPKLNTSPVLCARSYLNMKPQCSTHIQGSINTITIHSEKQSDSYQEKAKENEEEENDSPKNIHVNSSTPPDPSVAFITKKGDDGKVMFIELIRKNDDSSEGEPEEEGSTTTEEVGATYFDIFPTRSELAYHKYLMCSPIPVIFLRNPIIMKGCPSNLKIPCNIGHVHVEIAYIDPNSPLNIMTLMMYNLIMRRRFYPRKNSNRGVRNFTERIKGMHVFIRNFTCFINIIIVKDISLIIDPRLSQVVLGKPFVEISNMTHDPPKGVVRFANGTDEVTYKMPHMIEVVQVRRVTKVVKGGKQLHFRAVVVVGDKKGNVGVGVGKAKEVVTAVQKSATNARRNIVTVPMTKYLTFPHRQDGDYGAAKVMLRPASPGTGVIAGGAVRIVLEMAGVENALGKQLGSNNALNNARATVVAVQQMRQFSEVARDRGIPMEELWK